MFRHAQNNCAPNLVVKDVRFHAGPRLFVIISLDVVQYPTSELAVKVLETENVT